MNPIARLLTTDHIVTDLDANSKKRIFDDVSKLIEVRQELSGSTVFDALYAREKLGSTGLGLGVAIPHGRLKDLDHPVGVFLRLAHPIEFDSPDGQPVQLIFVLLVPESANEQHLGLIAELAQMFSDQTFRERLIGAPDRVAILEIFSAWQVS